MSSSNEAPDTWEFVDPRDLLKRHRLTAKRHYSQNFLVSEWTIRAIARAVDLAPTERCVELGPGLGTLTGVLVASGAEVIGVERDPDMIHVLGEELGRFPNFRVVDGDAGAFDLSTLMSGERKDKLVLAGNLPYAITDDRPQPRRPRRRDRARGGDGAERGP